MLRELVKIANKLDSIGLTKEADIIDAEILRFAAEGDPAEGESQNSDLTSDVSGYLRKIEEFRNLIKSNPYEAWKRFAHTDKDEVQRIIFPAKVILDALPKLEVGTFRLYKDVVSTEKDNDRDLFRKEFKKFLNENKGEFEKRYSKEEVEALIEKRTRSLTDEEKGIENLVEYYMSLPYEEFVLDTLDRLGAKANEEKRAFFKSLSPKSESFKELHPALKSKAEELYKRYLLGKESIKKYQTIRDEENSVFYERMPTELKDQLKLEKSQEKETEISKYLLDLISKFKSSVKYHPDFIRTMADDNFILGVLNDLKTKDKGLLPFISMETKIYLMERLAEINRKHVASGKITGKRRDLTQPKDLLKKDDTGPAKRNYNIEFKELFDKEEYLKLIRNTKDKEGNPTVVSTSVMAETPEFGVDYSVSEKEIKLPSSIRIFSNLPKYDLSSVEEVRNLNKDISKEFSEILKSISENPYQTWKFYSEKGKRSPVRGVELSSDILDALSPDNLEKYSEVISAIRDLDKNRSSEFYDRLDAEEKATSDKSKSDEINIFEKYKFSPETSEKIEERLKRYVKEKRGLTEEEEEEVSKTIENYSDLEEESVLSVSDISNDDLCILQLQSREKNLQGKAGRLYHWYFISAYESGKTSEDNLKIWNAVNELAESIESQTKATKQNLKEINMGRVKATEGDTIVVDGATFKRMVSERKAKLYSDKFSGRVSTKGLGPERMSGVAIRTPQEFDPMVGMEREDPQVHDISGRGVSQYFDPYSRERGPTITEREVIKPEVIER